MGGDRALNGSASLTIDLNGFPRGTRTASSHEGLFEQVTLNRGAADVERERDRLKPV
jgi:hypothetical protein